MSSTVVQDAEVLKKVFEKAFKRFGDDSIEDLIESFELYHITGDPRLLEHIIEMLIPESTPDQF